MLTLNPRPPPPGPRMRSLAGSIRSMQKCLSAGSMSSNLATWLFGATIQWLLAAALLAGTATASSFPRSALSLLPHR